MKLTEKEIELFKSLNQSETGNVLLLYLEKIKQEIGNIKDITSSNLEAKKEAIQAIDEFLIDKIKLANEDKEINNNPYV